MTNHITRITEHLTAESGSSRRRFISSLGKVAFGAAALASGQSLMSGVADAAVIPDNPSLPACCGSQSQACPTLGCPSGTYEDANSEFECCLNSNCFLYYCHVCRNLSDNTLNCLYSTHVCGIPQQCLCC